MASVEPRRRRKKRRMPEGVFCVKDENPEKRGRVMEETEEKKGGRAAKYRLRGRQRENGIY